MSLLPRSPDGALMCGYCVYGLGLLNSQPTVVMQYALAAQPALCGTCFLSRLETEVPIPADDPINALSLSSQARPGSVRLLEEV